MINEFARINTNESRYAREGTRLQDRDFVVKSTLADEQTDPHLRTHLRTLRRHSHRFSEVHRISIYRCRVLHRDLWRLDGHLVCGCWDLAWTQADSKKGSCSL